MTLRRLFAALLLALLACGQGLAGEPAATPFLRIEAGGHTGAVPRLAVDASGRLLATAGYDKTVRLWSLPGGAELAVLRPPIGTLEEGEIYAVALTPDGRRVFAAGATGGQWDGTFSIYVFDAAQARLISLLGGLPAPVYDLAVSPDGTRFAAGLAQGGVRVWSTDTGKPIFEDRAYAGPVRTVVFDRDGRLFTAAADGKVRAYDPDGRRFAEAQPPSGLRPWGLALSPDGGLLAIACENADRGGKLHVDVVSTRTLAPAFSPDTTGLEGEGLLAVAWASDARGGVQLYAAGYAHDASGYLIRRWGDFGLGAYADLPASRDTIRHLVPLPGGGAVYAAEDPGWGRIGPDGSIQQRPQPPMADLRPSRDHRLAVSADGGVVEFTTGAGPQRFDLLDRTLRPAASPDGSLAVARINTRGMTLANWRDSTAPTLNGYPLMLDHNELSRSAAELPDGSAVLLGTDTHLRLFARDRRQLAAIDTPAAAWAVTVAASGTVVVAALLDGSVRWYGLTGTEMLHERTALFAHADGARWVLFSPEGLFDDSDLGGNDLVGVHLNRGRNQQPDWISFSQAFRILYAPAVVRARLLGQSAPLQAWLAQLGDIRSRLARQPIVQVLGACLPRPGQDCRPLEVDPGNAISLPDTADSIRLTAAVTDRGLGLGPLDMFVNDRNAGRLARPAGGAPIALDVPLDPGPNTVQLRVYDASGGIFTESAPLRLARGEPGGATGPGRLFVLAIGVDNFANPELTLHYAVADARAFADGIRNAAAPLYQSVDMTLLLDSQATRAGILQAFERLAQEVRPRDTFLFYVASHGVLDETTNRFLLVPQDLQDISSWQAIARQAIDETTLVTALARIQARDALLFLDTCHSGKITADTLANVGHETGRYLLAASSSVQEALDSYDDRNGVFVYAVREALRGRAGEDADGNLGALTLGEYVSHRVGELARRKGHGQDAVFRTAQRDLHSFPIARIGPPR